MDSKTKHILAAIALSPITAAPLVYAVAQAPPAPLATPDDQAMRMWTFHHENVLGTSLQVTVRAANQAQAIAAEAAALAIFDHQNETLSAWKADSEFSRWSRTRFEPVPVSDDLFAVLAAFDTWRQRTNGALDPSVEAATRLWTRAASEGRTPNAREIAETQEAIAQPHWSLDAERRTATRLSDTPLALVSFAKSWVTSKAAEAALQAGAAGVVLNVGGDVVVRGALLQLITIADPRNATENGRPLQLVATVRFRTATS
jgi:thiamine biosynthesis lipoprotein